jgi:hypothetical protein
MPRKNLALDRAWRRKADALTTGKEIAGSRVCLKPYLVGQRRREQSTLQEVAGMDSKDQNSQGVDRLEQTGMHSRHQVPRFDSEAVLGAALGSWQSWIEELDRGTGCLLPKIGDERRGGSACMAPQGITGRQPASHPLAVVELDMTVDPHWLYGADYVSLKAYNPAR